MSKTLPELHGMLKTAEPNLRKTAKDPNVLMVQKGKGFKKSSAKDKGKAKAVQVADKDTPKPKPKSKAGPTDICRFCKEPGHWRRECKKFQEGLKELKKKTLETSSSGIFVIEVNTTTSDNTSWVMDTGCGAHICTNMQALSNSRRLKQGQVELRVGNGAKVPALAVGTYLLSLPSGLILELNNCYFVPAISRNIISISLLDLEGYDFSVKNKLCSFNRNNLFYGCAPLTNGLYILDDL
ncbi:C2HC-type zinc finger protein [Cutibacterium acnes]